MTVAFERGLNGDSRAYQEALSGISRIMRPYFLKRGLSQQDAEDVVQEVLLSVHKARHTYDASRPLIPWLFAIARFRFADFWRKRYVGAENMPVLDIQELQEILPAPVTEEDPMPEGMEEALSGLPEKKRRLLYMLHYEGYTIKEAATQLGMKESAVKVSAHRIYKHLRMQFGK